MKNVRHISFCRMLPKLIGLMIVLLVAGGVGVIFYRYQEFRKYAAGEVTSPAAAANTGSLSDFVYTPPTTASTQLTLPLTKFPDSYETLTSTLGTSLTRDQKILLLRNGYTLLNVEPTEEATVQQLAQSPAIPIYLTADSISATFDYLVTNVAYLPAGRQGAIATSAIQPQLESILAALQNDLLLRHSLLTQGQEKEVVKKAIMYTSIALALIDDSYSFPENVTTDAETLMSAFLAEHQGKNTCITPLVCAITWLGSYPITLTDQERIELLSMLTLTAKFSYQADAWQSILPNLNYLRPDSSVTLPDFYMVDQAIYNTLGYGFDMSALFEQANIDPIQTMLASAPANESIFTTDRSWPYTTASNSTVITAIQDVTNEALLSNQPFIPLTQTEETPPSTLYVESSPELYERLLYLLDYLDTFFPGQEQFATIRALLTATLSAQDPNLAGTPDTQQKLYSLYLYSAELLNEYYPNTQDLLLTTLQLDDETTTLALGTTLITTYSPEAISSTVDYANFNEDYDYELQSQASGSIRVPVWMYHNIDYPPSNSSAARLYVSPERFEEQMAYLLAKNYKSLTPTEFYTLLQNGENPTQKSVLLTFDDGTRGQYTTAFPIMQKYDMVGTFYIISSKSGITASELREMANAGMSIESHSYDHRDLRDVDATGLITETVTSKVNLEARTGVDIISFCYPGCVADAEVYTAVANAGYKFAFSCGTKIDHFYSHKYSLHRIHAYANMEKYKKALSGTWSRP